MAVYASPQYYSKLQRVEKEKEIFHFAFAILKEKVSLIGANTFGYSQELNLFILESGFKIRERYTMEITKEEIVALPNLQLPEEFDLISWDKKYVEEMIPVIFQYNKGSIDNELFGFFPENFCEILLLEMGESFCVWNYNIENYAKGWSTSPIVKIEKI